MSNDGVNPRVNRFRKVVSQSLLLPPPLPLINLPEESRLARTGLQSQRPMHLPVRRHLPNAVAVAALKAKATSPQDFDNAQPPTREPILHESRALLECQDEEFEELEVLARLHVYEYNAPDVFRNSSAPDDTLVFDSLFEGGNLQRAERIFRKTPTSSSHMPQHEYEMLIHPDIKNGAYRQWFYFEVRNGRPGATYRFALVNLAKSGALFGQGLQPVVYSEHDAATKGVGWRHRGTHVRYDVATCPNAQPGANALTFHYQFEHENDCVYFACIQPYTYTDLMDYLEQLERDPHRSLTCRRTELCQSLAGNSCDLLSITSPGRDGVPPDERRIIVLSARVHPGEPNSSWMMQGMLDYLTGSSSGATILRRHFIFKIVPMLNPDGVINGNTRVSLAGWDLNRKWSNPIEQLFPTVYHLKQQLAHFQARGRVAIYCDLHGHSINRNIFTYGCYTSKKKLTGSDGAKSSTDAASTATSPGINAVQTDPRVFPMIVARHAPCFSFASCDFSVHKSKLTTARVVVNQELGVTNSFTLEASFCGPDFGVHKDTQFSTWDLEEMGRSWCQSLLVYYGLTAHVKALDAERERQSAIGERTQTSIAVSSPTGRQVSRTRAEDGSLRTEAEDEESRLARDLLLDCEAAISALFAHSGMDVNDRVGSEDDAGGMDSDLSGAEEEPIPPSPDGRTQHHSPQVHSERVKQHDVDALIDDEGYSSAPEDFPSRKNRTSKASHTRKKAGRRKHTRSNVSKQKSAAIPTSRKGEGKSKKKKKRKGKSELRRTSLATAAASLGPKLEDATALTAEEPPYIALRSSVTGEESVLTSFPKKVTTSRRSKNKSGRPKSSYETPRSITSAILKATMNVDLASSRASLRLRPVPDYSTPSNSLLVLPSVLDGSNRSGSVRILKTAPSYDQEYPTLEEKTRFSLARVRSELPALQNSSRDEEQQRHSRLRVQENDDIRSDEGSDASSERSEPEAYTSSF
ncbi:Cytosolic carboxypeptidase 3 [Phytophthora fragariae]|uniref:Cytosolic carboxypeptidase 3 n=1 Tax=Phytophthora fragariae TaxID=53985 RepID=A0A6A4EYU6_9STRA|nr:Cytosolic carboxypeptidase 3 [Phytophthora fragariae]KAE8939437.1 Cytosolic carboxypeptidase 3 [Phytophthora fragariae]KAE9016312.1 Cytosolic carboxypeptidase 3 [Phytophthora fragariae]KAE9116148.1 Cytosolic carboxypeptidase 3 [Phytophthora fragariae]KAE9116286.1 Cytosolic carboxypeptidase 3 [Phytophthora fragariae]